MASKFESAKFYVPSIIYCIALKHVYDSEIHVLNSYLNGLLNIEICKYLISLIESNGLVYYMHVILTLRRNNVKLI